MPKSLQQLEQDLSLAWSAADAARSLFAETYGDRLSRADRDRLPPEGRGLLNAVIDLTKKAVEARRELDRAYAQAEEEFAPAPQNFTLEEAKAWVGQMVDTAEEAAGRLREARRELASLPDPLSKTPGDLTSEDWDIVDRRLELLGKIEEAYRVMDSADASLENAYAVIDAADRGELGG